MSNIRWIMCTCEFPHFSRGEVEVLLCEENMKIILVVGARPNFMKVAPLWNRLAKAPDLFDPILVHTGQHYDDLMSEIFLRDLNLPRPHYELNVGSGSHAYQTAQIMMGFEEVLLLEKPDWVLVVGDVNSTLACAMDAAKLQIPVGHIEAGLRSWDRSMPEEINRLVVDAISDLLFAPSKQASENLRREGIEDHRIHFVGNVMIDSMMLLSPKADESRILDRHGLLIQEFVFLTLHRASNVDCADTLAGIVSALQALKCPIVWPLHPRTRNRLSQFGFLRTLEMVDNVKLMDPVGYLDSLKLQKNAKFVMTDSGGLQEETTVLGVPCLTLRENTERPETINIGTNTLVGIRPERILAEAESILNGCYKSGCLPELWDGNAAERIVAVLKS